MRILSVDGLDIGRTPGGEQPRDVIWPQLTARMLGDMVIYAPEDDVALWERTSRLVLVDGRHGYAGVRDDVEFYSPRLAPGGYQLFHDYAYYFPDMPRYVNELLMDPEFEFVAHVGTLIAFARRAGSPASRVDEKVRVKWRGQEALPTAPIWMYWEGPIPTYIALCCKTAFAHNEHVVLLNRASFEDLFVNNPDIDIDALPVHHRSDFIRASLLKHYSGLYLDARCIIMRSLSPILEMVKQSGFVGYRDQQGNKSNNLMASTAGGDVTTAFYNDICTILPGDEQLEWCRLGSIPLEM